MRIIQLCKDLEKDPFRDRDGQGQHLKDQKEQEASVKANLFEEQSKSSRIQNIRNTCNKLREVPKVIQRNAKQGDMK